MTDWLSGRESDQVHIILDTPVSISDMAKKTLDFIEKSPK